MKFFSWVQNKLNGKQGSNKSICPTYTREAKEEFSDWPQAFLSIGTLGAKDLKDDTKVQNHNNLETQELTSEEVTQLQKEVNALVSNCDLDSLATLEATKGERSVDGEEETHVQHKQHFATIASCNNKAISKKSVPFLLKKMFMCGAGFGPVPSLRDPMLSAPQTRMEKNKIKKQSTIKKLDLPNEAAQFKLMLNTQKYTHDLESTTSQEDIPPESIPTHVQEEILGERTLSKH
ncbi:hypothetical protein Cgig2_009633 [Carnegiea gigantea]|uniref:Uncharacterized protein n=1 Tax=Carnegiea gigantea TaxID=171969 RepID=A0A9Q1JTT7_9CARY|nr:hypothetical protein Cgig2_009633 [Carnegiea gigantea]